MTRGVVHRVLLLDFRFSGKVKPLMMVIVVSQGTSEVRAHGLTSSLFDLTACIIEAIIEVRLRPLVHVITSLLEVLRLRLV